MSNIRLYGPGNGTIFAIRSIHGTVYIGTFNDQVTLGTPLHNQIMELGNKYILYKSTNHELFGEYGPRLKGLIIVGIRQGKSKETTSIMHNDLKGEGTTSNSANGIWKHWALTILLGHQYVDGETAHNLPFGYDLVPEFNKPDTFGEQAKHVLENNLSIGHIGRFLPTLLICNTDELPCSDDNISSSISTLPPRPPLLPSSVPTALLVCVSSVSILSLLLIPISCIQDFYPNKERIRAFLERKA